MKLNNDLLELIPDGEIFANRPVYFMEPFDDKTLLIGTAEDGFYLFDGNKIIPFATNTVEYLKENHLYCGTRIDGELYALGTRLGGICIMDHDGNLLKTFNNDEGLQDNSVWNMHYDSQGNLWLALNNGITKVEMPSSVSVFSKESGLEGVVEKVYRHKDNLYVATNLGIFYLDNLPDNSGWRFPRFKRIPDLNEYCWSILSYNDMLLTGTTGGVYEIKDKRASKIPGLWNSVFEILPSKYHSNLFILSTRNGVGLLYRRNNQWFAEGYIPNLAQKIYHAVEKDSITLWLETATKGTIKLEMLSGSNVKLSKQSVRISHFTNLNGLPPERVFPIMVSNELFFSTPEGMYQFNSGTFSKAEQFNLKGTWGFLGAVDNSGSLWISGYEKYGEGEKIYRGIKTGEGIYEWEKSAFLNLPEIAYVNTIYPEDKNVTWIGTSEGLLRFDNRFKSINKVLSNTLIRRIVINSDSTLDFNRNNINPMFFDFSNNNIRFEYALTDYKEEHENQYQTFLEGFDKGWSKWSLENRKDYTNLPHGDFVFRVKGKNFSDNIGNEAAFYFSIAPPWYKSFWAYTVYILFLVFFGLVIDRIQRKRLIKKERQNSQLREGKIIKEKNFELEKTLVSLKMAQKELLHSESRFRSVAQLANDAIITSNKSNCIIFWNKHAEKIFGYSAEEALGKPLTILMPERYRNDHIKGMERFINTNEMKIIGKVVELNGLRKDGSEFPVELTLSNWDTEEGKFVTGIIRDITRRKEEQLAKEKAYELLENENRRKSKELEKACSLQHSMLPKEIPQTEKLEVAAYMRTAIEVGGDYYDFYNGNNGNFTAVIGDAAGHGLEAGMMVAATKSLISSLIQENDLSKIFNITNQIFKNLNLKKMFMALQMIRFKDSQLEICSAGMPPVLIYRKKENLVEEVVIKAVPLGVLKQFPFNSIKINVAPGDCIILMSDGFPERFNERKEMFGYERPKSVLMKMQKLSSEEIIEHLINIGNDWAGTTIQNDDITFIVIKLK
ncbi:MAG: SpoIIE family protein phosphatase [Ignavibacteriaceae bacterium]